MDRFQLDRFHLWIADILIGVRELRVRRDSRELIPLRSELPGLEDLRDAGDP